MNIEELLEQKKAVQVKTTGNSMTPFLIPGIHEAVIESVDVSILRRGDVVLYRRISDMESESGKLVLHRIWKRRGDTFSMLGDSQTEPEGPIVAEQIKGRLEGIAREENCRSVRDPLYRILSGIWLTLRPFRPVLLRIGHFIKKFT